MNDDPDAPVTSDWIGTSEVVMVAFSLTCTATPSDFVSMTTPLTVRAHVGSLAFTTDTCSLYAQVFAADETTAYTAPEVSLATQASSGLVTANMTVNATGLAATKANWDAARLRLRWDYTA